MEKCCTIKSKKAKFILSFLSATIFQFGVSVLIATGNLNVYFISYIRHKDSWVNMQYGNIMTPCMMLFLSAFSPLSGVMENLVGPRLTLLISGLIMELSLFLFYLQRNLFLFYSIALLLGFGSGLSANIAIKNACYYYPRKKGVIGSGVMSIAGLGIGFYSAMGERIINPNGEKVKNIKDPFYSEEVSMNTKKFFLFAMIVIPICLFLTLLLFFKYDPSVENESVDQIKGPLLEEGKDKEEKETKRKQDDDKEHKEEKRKPDVSNSYMKPAPKHNIKRILTNIRFWRNILFAGIMPFWCSFLMATYRVYVSMIQVDPNIIKNLSAFLSVISCAFGPIWAFCVDKCGFPPVIKVIAALCIALTSYFTVFIDNKFFYVLGLIFSFSTRIGIMSSINPHIMHIYGMRYFLIIGGFFRLFDQLCGFTASVLSVILSIFFKNAEQLKQPYRIVAIVGICFSIIGFILTFFETNEKFDFEGGPVEDLEEPSKKKGDKGDKENNAVKEKNDEEEDNNGDIVGDYQDKVNNEDEKLEEQVDKKPPEPSSETEPVLEQKKEDSEPKEEEENNENQVEA